MSGPLLTTIVGAVLVVGGTLKVVDHIDIVFDPFSPLPRADVFAVYAIALGCVLVAAGMIASYMELAR